MNKNFWNIMNYFLIAICIYDAILGFSGKLGGVGAGLGWVVAGLWIVNCMLRDKTIDRQQEVIGNQNEALMKVYNQLTKVEEDK